MAAIKSTDAVHGVTYAVADAVGNEVVLANGQPILGLPLQPQTPGTPTALLMFAGTTLRLTQANATAWPFTAGQSFTGADGSTVSFVATGPVYAGGTYEGVNTGGVRMLTKGLFVDFTAANMTDLDVPLAAFGSSGAIT